MDTQIADDLRAQAMAAVAAWLRRDQAGFDAIVGTPEESQVLLPVVISELCTALEQLTSPGDLRREVDGWLEEHRARLAGN